MVIGASGSFRPSFKAAIFGSFHFTDAAQINIGQHLAGELQFTRLDALHIYPPAPRRRSRSETAPNLLFPNLPLSGANQTRRNPRFWRQSVSRRRRADRLIINAAAACRLIGLRPLHINRLRKRSAGAGDVQRHFIGSGSRRSGRSALLCGRSGVVGAAAGGQAKAAISAALKIRICIMFLSIVKKGRFQTLPV